MDGLTINSIGRNNLIYDRLERGIVDYPTMNSIGRNNLTYDRLERGEIVACPTMSLVFASLKRAENRCPPYDGFKLA